MKNIFRLFNHIQRCNRRWANSFTISFLKMLNSLLHEETRFIRVQPGAGYFAFMNFCKDKYRYAAVVTTFN
ncbi:MAG: hypothetical protein WAR78_14150 [Ferruginibacter sp.]